MEEGYTIERIHELTKIDPWFLGKLKNIVDYKAKLSAYDKVEDIPADVLREAKVLGFSDFQIARFVLNPVGNMEKENLMVRARRKELGILPAVKRINTIASEHPELTNYLYMTYAVQGYDVNYYKNEKSVVVLGSGAYRIGSSVEFDWCSVNAVQTARKLGYKSIMINYNPETVSTDYDMCDRLYFDELSFERVLDVIDLEQPRGVIVSVGGQIPNNLAMKLYRQSVPVLGTSPISIDRAENRNKFSAMLDQLGIDQPAWQELTSLEDVKGFVEKVGYPVLVRPSYVLSGAAMNVCYDDEELENFLKMAAEVSKEYPVVVSQFLENTKEIEFDAVAQNGEVVEYAISEHIEFAGVHSGDATLVFPAQKIYFATARRIKKISRQIAKELNISGPFNIQFLARNNEVKVIECNLRASRSFPFVSKVLKRNFIETATRIMLDAPYSQPDKTAFDIDWIGVKASQFSFSRLHKADPVLGVDMSSTGEVGCIGDDFSEALLNAMIATGFKIPEKAVMFSSGAMKSKVDLLDASRMLFAKGYQIYATAGTAAFLNAHGVDTIPVYWPDEKPGCCCHRCPHAACRPVPVLGQSALLPHRCPAPGRERDSGRHGGSDLHEPPFAGRCGQRQNAGGGCRHLGVHPGGVSGRAAGPHRNFSRPARRGPEPDACPLRDAGGSADRRHEGRCATHHACRHPQRRSRPCGGHPRHPQRGRGVRPAGSGRRGRTAPLRGQSEAGAFFERGQSARTGYECNPDSENTGNYSIR